MAKAEFTDAIALLKADHRKVEDLFEQFEKARAANRKQEIAHQICTELKIHTTIEEEIFYPAFRGKIEDDTLDEAERRRITLVEVDSIPVIINLVRQHGYLSVLPQSSLARVHRPPAMIRLGPAYRQSLTLVWPRGAFAAERDQERDPRRQTAAR